MNFIIPRNLWYGIILKSTDIYIIYIYNISYCKLIINSIKNIQVNNSVYFIKFEYSIYEKWINQCIQFVYNMKYLNCRKFYFRKKGAWVSYRRRWPYIITTKFGRGHPYRIKNYIIFIRRFKRYIQFSNLLFLHIEKNNLDIFIKNFQTIQGLSVYTRRGLTLSRTIFIKKQGKISQYSKLKSKIF